MKDKVKNKAHIFANVRKVETAEILPDYSVTSANSHAVVVDVPKEDGSTYAKIVNFCSADYQIIENQFIADTFESIIGDDMEFTKRYSHMNHCHYYMDYVLKGESQKVLKVDEVIPKLRIVNSYNGRLRLQVKFGFHRVVCKNGMTVPIEGGENKSMMHTPSFFKLYEDWAKVVKGFKEFVADAPKYNNIYQSLAASKFRPDQLQAKVREIIEQTKFPKRQEDAVIEGALFETQTHSIPMSDWVLYNALNFQLNHNKAIQMETTAKDTLDGQVLNLILNL